VPYTYGMINHILSNFRLQPLIYIKMLITVLQLIIWHVLIQHFLLEMTCVISWSLDCLCVTFSLLLKSIPETAVHIKIHIRHSNIWKITTGAQIPGARLSWWLHFVCWCLMFMRSLVGSILHVMLLVGMGHRFWKICALLNCSIGQPTGPRCAGYCGFYYSNFREDLVVVLMLIY